MNIVYLLLLTLNFAHYSKRKNIQMHRYTCIFILVHTNVYQTNVHHDSMIYGNMYVYICMYIYIVKHINEILQSKITTVLLLLSDTDSRKQLLNNRQHNALSHLRINT